MMMMLMWLGRESDDAYILHSYVHLFALNAGYNHVLWYKLLKMVKCKHVWALVLFQLKLSVIIMLLSLIISYVLITLHLFGLLIFIALGCIYLWYLSSLVDVLILPVIIFLLSVVNVLVVEKRPRLYPTILDIDLRVSI